MSQEVDRNSILSKWGLAKLPLLFKVYGWRRQLVVRPRIGFAPVQIAPEAAPAGAVDRGMIEIEFATGARMRITGAVDAAALTAAVAVLAEGRRR